MTENSCSNHWVVWCRGFQGPGPGCGPRVRPNPRASLGRYSTDNIQIWAKFWLVQLIAMKCKIEHSGFLGLFLFHKEKLFTVALIPCLWCSSGWFSWWQSNVKENILAFFGYSFFTKKISSQLHSSHAYDAVRHQKKSHWLDFLGDFCSCPSPEMAQHNTFQTWHPVCLLHSSNAKITSDVLRASLHFLLKEYWHLCIKRNMY
jgi:hypothetical protein